MTKTCSKCGQTKALEDFHKRAAAKDGHDYRCKQCVKEFYAAPKHGEYRRKYYLLHKNPGIDQESLDAAFATDSSHCAICQRPIEGKNKHIDHDHKTGMVRGWLCHGCNVGLGHFRDDPELLQRAIRYLKIEPQKSLAVSEEGAL